MPSVQCPVPKGQDLLIGMVQFQLPLGPNSIHKSSLFKSNKHTIALWKHFASSCNLPLTLLPFCSSPLKPHKLSPAFVLACPCCLFLSFKRKHPPPTANVIIFVHVKTLPGDALSGGLLLHPCQARPAAEK